jgi:hypothetical protein
METLLTEDTPALSFSPDDVCRLIEESGIEPATGLAIDEIAVQLRNAVIPTLIDHHP